MENSEHNKVSIIDEQESLQIYGGLLTEVIAGILLTYALAEYPDITKRFRSRNCIRPY